MRERIPGESGDEDVERAARNLSRAADLVVRLNYLAWVILALSLLTFAASIGDQYGSLTAGYALGGLVTWGVLRGLATLIQLRVDDALLEED